MLLGNEILGDTREMTKKKVKAAKKKVGKTAVGKATVGKKQTKRTKAAKVVGKLKILCVSLFFEETLGQKFRFSISELTEQFQKLR